MSYDIYLRAEPCDKCGNSGPEPSLPDPTYNLTPIFDLALTGEPLPNADTSELAVVVLGKETDRPRGLRVLNGRKAKSTVGMIDNALKRLGDPALREQFIALEPENKWGTLPDAVYIFKELRTAAEEYPENTWEIR